MDNESLNWFRFAKCLVDVGNKVLRRYLYFYASTYSLSGYPDVWQKKVKDHCKSDDMKVLWTSLNQQGFMLDVTSQQVFQPLITKWKDSIKGPPMKIRKQLSTLDSWEMKLQDTISKTPTQQNTLSKFSDEIQKLVTEHSLLLTAVSTWTKDFIYLCHMNQLDLLHWIEQHNERTSSVLSTFLQEIDITYIRQGSEDLNNALKTCQQDEGNSSTELKNNVQTSFISWQSKLDKLINSWATNCINQKILQNLLTDMKNDLPNIHNKCQVNVNDICSTWHKNLRKELAELNHQLEQVGESTVDLQNLVRKWHTKLKEFPSVLELQTKEFFDSKKTDLQSHKKRHHITEPQWSLIFPSKDSINLEAFDITLSSTLLRNICPVFPPELGWSGEILDTDYSMGADLMRLKNLRNDYFGHISHLDIPDSDFEKILAILETILHRLSMPLGNGFWQEIQEKITELRTCSFDVHEERKLHLELLNWFMSDSGQRQEKLESFCQELLEKVQTLTNQNDVILLETQHLKTKIGNMSEGILIPRLEGLEEKSANTQRCITEITGIIPQMEGFEKALENIQRYMTDQMVNRTRQNQRIYLTKGKIKSHIDDKKDVHIQTRAYNHARDILLEHRHLVLQGKPGDGKTHTALSLIAYLMETKSEMQPLMINNPNEWEELVDMKQPLIVLMDNVLGKYGVSETDLIKWEQLSELIHPNTGESSIFLIVCLRSQIPLKIKRSLQRNEALSWMLDSNVINISDEKHCLTKQEKTEMLKKYATKHSKETSSFVVDDIVNTENLIGFPENCRIWSCKPNLALDDVYANNKFLVEEIEDISRKSQQDYLFLVLLMLSGGSLSLDKNTEELISNIKKISKLCGMREKLNIGQCKDIGNALCSTFVEYDTETKTFSFQHDTIESAVFFCFGSDYAEITLEMCSLQSLTKMCCVRNKGNISNDSFLNFKIIIEEDAYFKVIVERFSKGLESRKRELFQCVAEALVWQSTRFSDYFLKTLTSSDDVVTFLSKKDLDKQSLLAYFIYADNTMVVKGILEKISQFNIRDHDLVSRQILLATVNACMADKTDIFNYLVGFQGKVDDFVMFAAASTGNVSLMDKLLHDGGNLNAMISVKLSTNFKYAIKNCVSYPNNESHHHDINLLHIACNYGRTDMVMYLNKKCPELLHKTSSLGFTAAHFVTCSENVDLMNLLLSEGLDIERKNLYKCTVLHSAALNRNVNMVKYLIKTFPQMAHQTDRNGWTVLHYSCRRGSVRVLKALLENGLDIMARTDDGSNVLHISALFNKLHMVKYLIKTYPKLVKQTDNEGNTAVHYAAFAGGVPMMEFLIQKGLDITARTNDGSHVLHQASCNDNLPMVNHLIKTIPELIHQTNKHGCSALHCAGRGGSVSVINALLQAGLNITARSNNGYTVLHLAALSCNSDRFSTMNYLVRTHPQLKHDITNNGWTILHCCCKGDNISAIELLLQEGFDIKDRTIDGSNALHIASGNNNLAIVNYLIKECLQLIQETNNKGFTALHNAAQGGDVQVIEALIKAGSDIMARTSAGYNILHLAAFYNNLSAMEYLMKTYPQLKDDITNDGWTALHCCSQVGSISTIELLLQEGFDIKARTELERLNALHIAAGNKNLAIVNYLINKCPQLIQETNINMFMVLHFGAQGGDVQVIEALIKAGSDIMARTNVGYNILHLAAFYNNLSAMEYLMKTYPQLKDDSTNDGRTALHCCSQGGSISAIELLLQEGFDIKARTKEEKLNSLHIAAGNKNLAIVNYLIEKCSQLSQETNNKGFSALHCAAQGGDVQVIEALIKAGSDIMARTNAGHNILHLAAFYNNLSAMEYLMKTYPQLKDDITNDGWTALHCCSQGGSISAIEVLLQEGFDIKDRTIDGSNALHIAAGNKNLAIVNYLIKEFSHLIQETNNKGFTALHCAVQGGDVQVIEALIKPGSDMMARTNAGQNILHFAAFRSNLSAMEYLMKTYPQLKDDITNDGWTALHCCSQVGGVSAIELLLQEGFDIKDSTIDGSNALHIAAGNKNLAVVNYLINLYSHLIQETNNKGFTALHCAAQGGDVQVIEALIKAGSDIIARTNAGYNILHLAAFYNNLSAMEYLMKTYPQLKGDSTNDGWTALHCCSQGGGVSAIELLLQEGFDIKDRTIDGSNALHIAAGNKNLAIVNCLITECSQLIQETNNEGFTALHCAAQGYVQVIEALIKAESNIMARTNAGYNILHLAAFYNNLSAMEYLMKTYPQLKDDITNDGWTALHCCSQVGGISAIELLLQEGFDIKARTKEGLNAFDIAARNRNFEIVNYLKRNVDK